MAAQNLGPVTVTKTIEEDVTELEKVSSIDTVHQDEAVKILATYNGDQSWEKEEESKLRRKIDWKLMPILCITYALQYYDKAMLGQAVSRFLSHPETVL